MVGLATMGVVLGGKGGVGDDGTSAFAELTLCHVDLRRGVVGGRAVDSIEMTVVGPVLNVDGVGGRRLGGMGVARSFEFDAVKTLRLWLGWLATRKLLAFVEAPSCVQWLLGLAVLDAGLFVDVDLLPLLLGRLPGLLEASLFVDVHLLALLGRLLGLLETSLFVNVHLLTVLAGLLLLLLRLSVVCLLVDVDLFPVLVRTTQALFLVDADLLLDLAVVLRWAWGWRVNGGCEGFVPLFVTFPSVGRSLFLKLDVAFYLNTGRFLVGRVPIRRREDTEGDRNSRFKIQFAGVVALCLEDPSNRSKTIRKESRTSFLAPL